MALRNQAQTIIAVMAVRNQAETKLIRPRESLYARTALVEIMYLCPYFSVGLLFRGRGPCIYGCCNFAFVHHGIRNKGLFSWLSGHSLEVCTYGCNSRFWRSIFRA